MALFSYRASLSSGKNSKGRISAVSKTSAIEELLAGGLTPITITEVTSQGSGREWLFQRERDLSAHEVGMFAGDVSRLLASGFSLHQALQMVAASADSRQVEALAKQATAEVGRGGTLSSVLSKETGGPAAALTGLVQAGETAGRLDVILHDAAKSFQGQAEFKSRITSAMIYPAIILFMISLTLLIFFSFVLPKLQPLFEDVGDGLPLMTRGLLAFGRFCETGLPWLLLAFLIVFVCAQFAPKFKLWLRFKFDGWLLGSISMGVPRLVGYAAYSRTLGLLLGAGVPMPAANLVAAGGVANRKLSEDLRDLTPNLRTGHNLSEVIASKKDVPEILLRMLYVGERSGKIAPTLSDAADLIERKANIRLDRFLSALTPVITIFLGLIVALIVASLFLGIASLTDVQI